MLVREKRDKDIKQCLLLQSLSNSPTLYFHCLVKTLLLCTHLDLLLYPLMLLSSTWAGGPLIHSLRRQWVKSPPLHGTSQFFVPFSQALISLCDSYVQVSGLSITMATQMLFFPSSSVISSPFWPATPMYSPWILSLPVILLLQNYQSEYSFALL